MKFAIVATLFASVAALCEPAKYHTELYLDSECKELDVENTNKYGEVPLDKYELYKEGCHNVKSDFGVSYIMKCDDKTITETLYKDYGCEEPIGGYLGEVSYKFNECQKAIGQDVYFIIKKDA